MNDIIVEYDGIKFPLKFDGVRFTNGLIWTTDGKELMSHSTQDRWPAEVIIILLEKEIILDAEANFEFEPAVITYRQRTKQAIKLSVNLINGYYYPDKIRAPMDK